MAFVVTFLIEKIKRFMSSLLLLFILLTLFDGFIICPTFWRELLTTTLHNEIYINKYNLQLLSVVGEKIIYRIFKV